MRAYRHEDHRRLIAVEDANDVVRQAGRDIGGGRVALPVSIKGISLLRNQGVRDVPRLMDDYSFPGVEKPYYHQIETSEFFLYHRRLWCLNDMRTGKTFSACWSIDVLQKYGELSRTLVLCPLSIVREAWMSSFGRVNPMWDVEEATGSTKQANEAIRSGARILVANHDKVKYNLEALLEFNPDLIVIDESSVFKSSDSDRYKALRHLVSKSKCRIWALTATPAPKTPTAVWAMARLINPSAVPYMFSTFRDKVMREIPRSEAPSIWIPREGYEEEVLKALQPHIRFRLRDCIDVPPMVMVHRRVPMGAKHTAYYNKLKRHGAVVMDSGESITAANAAVLVGKLLQVSSGMVYNKKKQAVEVDASTKLTELTSIIEESVGKVIVFTPFVSVMRYVSKKLQQKGYKAGMLPSTASLTKRTETFDAFQNSDELDVLVSHADVCRYGLTLTSASTVVWWGPIFSPETFIQANHRPIGRKQSEDHKIVVIMLSSTDAEYKLFNNLIDQDDAHSAIINVYKQEVIQ